MAALRSGLLWIHVLGMTASPSGGRVSAAVTEPAPTAHLLAPMREPGIGGRDGDQGVQPTPCP